MFIPSHIIVDDNTIKPAVPENFNQATSIEERAMKAINAITRAAPRTIKLRSGSIEKEMYGKLDIKWIESQPVPPTPAITIILAILRTEAAISLWTLACILALINKYIRYMSILEYLQISLKY